MHIPIPLILVSYSFSSLSYRMNHSE
ncbi:hypothetical protein F383_02550 [Gossypium arboreum]|uniref:Uncharacterized protein n=1 Tax=Gossypium arboreum TaxID=29729 RepID=A0A0B0PRT7_GOSAR|nr:hypothetical protein F383_02550 [Gossypium arboreum]